MPRKTKYPELKIHLYEYASAYCKTNSWHSIINDNPGETTCKTCLGLYQIQKGKIDQMPFGGNLDKNGNERDNSKSKRWNKNEG